MALKLVFKFAQRLYLSNDSGQGVVGPSTVYSEATLVFSSFCEEWGQVKLRFCLLSSLFFDRIDRNLSDNQMLINVINIYRLPMRRL